MKKLLFCILDGFGYSKSASGNATLEARYVTSLVNAPDTKFLEASGRSVGLPDGQFGNSEVGHLTIGAGRVLKQKLPLISDAIHSGELAKHPDLQKFLSQVKNNTCHLMGLFSSGGVHSDIEHFFWAISILRKRDINIKAHLFLDGRDVGFREALPTLKAALAADKIRLSEIATVQGRFFAMDRDNKLDRTEAAYNAITRAVAEYHTEDPLAIIRDFYAQNINDETIPPFAVGNYSGADTGASFWMLNFRTDRIKQILIMLLDGGFHTMNMVDCGENIDARSTVLFPTREVRNTFGEVLAQNGISQLRIAETEKYAHVTYFFNGGLDVQFQGEDRILIPSPKVKDYAETPDMSATAITEKLIDAMERSSHQVIIANYANADMLGHTGDFGATKKSMQLLDAHIKKVVDTARKNGYGVILTADHGNAEIMMNEDGTPKKTHTCSLVPFITIPETPLPGNLSTLADIAPTLLNLLELPVPGEMQ
ncbi:MAG: 2,3-bisphosphoglycerate-independent phosphoglycerate mutase [Alphaproteobacteria bacterium]|nr:2,3-bisphosphoglycerate-independent phosphoglycerate mutase [Alphaproteobacteria bacterium]